VGAGSAGLLLEGSDCERAVETILRDSFEDVVRYAEAHNVNNRIAAYMLAIDRVAFTIKQRGLRVGSLSGPP